MTDRLNALLISTEPYGEARVSRFDTGWRATIDLPAPVGCTASVASDFTCPTPIAAVEQMLERMASLRSAIDRTSQARGTDSSSLGYRPGE